MSWLTNNFHNIPIKYSTNWEAKISHLHASPGGLHTLYYGTEVKHQSEHPIYLPVSSLDSHMLVHGPTRAGKTSIAIKSLLIQLARISGQAMKLQRPDLPTKSIVIIDLKGDSSLMHLAKLEAERASIPFKLITNVMGFATHGFNPYMQKMNWCKSVQGLSEFFVNCLNLDYGQGYGRQFFSTANHYAFHKAIKHFGQYVQSFAELYPYLEGPKSDLVFQQTASSGLNIAQHKKEMEGMFKTLAQLADVELLNITPDSKHGPNVYNHQLDLLDVITNPTIVYCYLDPESGGTIAPTIGKLIFAGLSSAAATRQNQSLISHQPDSNTPNRTYIITDEFQKLIADNIGIVFEQASGRGISIVASHQNENQLSQGGVDLKSTIVSNSNMKWIFGTPSIDDMKELQQYAGTVTEFPEVFYDDIDDVLDAINYRPSHSPFWHGLKTQQVPRLKLEDILEVNSDPRLSILRVNSKPKTGQHQIVPIILRCEHPITLSDAIKHEKTPWPNDLPGTFVQSSFMPKPKRLDPTPAPPKPDSLPAEEKNQPTQKRSRQSSPTIAAFLKKQQGSKGESK